MMVSQKLKKIEIEAAECYTFNGSRLRAVARIREWLKKNDIDFEALCENKLEYIQQTLTSLKGEALTKSEKLVLEELVNA